MLLTDEEIRAIDSFEALKVDAMEPDRLIAKAQLKKDRERLSNEWLEVNLAHKLEEIVKAADAKSFYLYYRRHAKDIVAMFQALLKEVE